MKIKKNPWMSRCPQTFDWYCIWYTDTVEKHYRPGIYFTSGIRWIKRLHLSHPSALEAQPGWCKKTPHPAGCRQSPGPYHGSPTLPASKPQDPAPDYRPRSQGPDSPPRSRWRRPGFPGPILGGHRGHRLRLPRGRGAGGPCFSCLQNSITHINHSHSSPLRLHTKWLLCTNNGDGYI